MKQEIKNINAYIIESFSSVSKNAYVVPNIPEKKLNNAVRSMGVADSVRSIIALYDNTVFGSSKEGFLLTGKSIYIKELLEDSYAIAFEEIKSVEYIKDVKVNDKGKESVERRIEITQKDDSKFELKGLMDCDYEKLADLLSFAITEFDEFEEEIQMLSLSEMPEELKIAYVKVIINMAIDNDGVVDEKEMAEIFLLMTRLELSKEARFDIRSFLSTAGDMVSTEELVSKIDKLVVASYNKSIKISLVKDLINVHMSVNEGEYADFDFLNKNKKLFGVSDEEIELAVDAIKIDYKMLTEEFTDAIFEKSMKELGAKAGAVGVPLAAVYLSGSVIGMSAAGMTSGLATIGMGGVLGFSSMATGIGVAVLVGVGAYKGIRHFTGANELDKAKRKELMLNEVIKQTQTTISYLIDDLNFIATRLTETIKSHSAQDAKIQRLVLMMGQLSSATNVVSIKSNAAQSSSYKLSSPRVLDVKKLEDLTREPTKQAAYNAVLSFYVQKKISKEVDGEEKLFEQWERKDNISTNDLDKLAKVFDAVGYYKPADVIRGKISGLFS